jgi:Domain of unknown function (DUF4412)
MKKYFSLLTFATLGLGLLTASAQFGARGGGPQGPQFGGALDTLFGDHQAFSATMEFQTHGRKGEDMIMPGKFNYDSGKTRFEMDIAEMKGAGISPEATAQMKTMGMDSTVSLSRPDENLMFIVYPGLECYAQMPLPAASAKADAKDFKVETTELGKETVDGHPCVKNKVTVTGKDGEQHISTVWNATDLKNFPVKIVTTENGQDATMLYKNISFDKPAASLFEPPASYTKYDNMQTMMQAEVMKKMTSGMGMPHPPMR